MHGSAVRCAARKGVLGRRVPHTAHADGMRCSVPVKDTLKGLFGVKKAAAASSVSVLRVRAVTEGER